MESGEISKSEQILAQVKKEKSNTEIVDVAEESSQLIIFTLHGEFFSIDGDSVKEILTVGKINRLPCSPDFLLGIINVRGDIESVLDINYLLKMDKEVVSSSNRIIIAEDSGTRTGILVGSVVDVVKIPKSSIKKPISILSGNIRDFVAGEFKHNGKDITLLTVDKLFCRFKES